MKMKILQAKQNNCRAFGRVGRITALLAACAFSSLIAQTPRIKDVTIVGESRGLMLVVQADAPIRGEVVNPQNEYSSLTIKLDGVKNGLEHSEFSHFEKGPVSKLLLREDRQGVKVELNFGSNIKGPASMRGIDNRLLVLLTEDSNAGIHWEASEKIRLGKTGAAPEETEVASEKKEVASETKPQEQNAREDALPGGLSEDTSVEFEIAPPSLTEQLPEVKEERAVEAVVRYNVHGRDPFIPIVFDTTSVTDLPRVQNLKLVGILEDDYERIALLENIRDYNRAYAMREDDPLENGKILRIHRDKVVFLIREYDVSRTYTLNLTN
ncbi:hypothetical protein CHISP_1376 [Chitinispirillum alkaliphilum]|nr:hypothetical protein CHISP_1376 [Chitinispirillum alkaliphilum]